MLGNRRPVARRALVLGATLLVVWGGEARADTERPVTQSTMREIFQALTVAYRLSFDDDPEQREAMTQALRALSNSAHRLLAHGGELNQSFDFLRASLARDAREALYHYESGNHRSARFVLQELTENCFACHSKLPSERTFGLGKEFLASVRIADLEPVDRARLEVATRQFDAALSTYEQALQSRAESPTYIDLNGTVSNYLRIALCVRNDPARAEKALLAFQKRPDTPRYLRDHVERWRETLNVLKPVLNSKRELEAARRAVAQAQSRAVFPSERYGLVQYVAAQCLLNRFVDSNPKDADVLAEAFYLLGVADAHITHGIWVSETEYFLEASIRFAPGSRFAEPAYAFLEEYILTGYTGSAGVNLPPDMSKLLDELRALIDSAN